jgi:hypothetical protein
MFERRIQPISRTQFDAIGVEIKRRIGVDFDADHGIFEIKGFRVQYNYQEDLQSLHVQLLSKPWFIPESLIASKVDEYLAGPGKEW